MMHDVLGHISKPFEEGREPIGVPQAWETVGLSMSVNVQRRIALEVYPHCRSRTEDVRRL